MHEQGEFLLPLIASKVDKLEKALERNWIAHLILAGIGFAFVFDIGDLQQSFAKYFGQDQYNEGLPAVLILPVLLYYFSRFGHLLSSFIRARALYDDLLKAYLGVQFSERRFRPLQQTSSFFEVLCSTQAFDRATVLAFFAVTLVVISVAQAAALFLVLQAYGRTAWPIGAGSLAVLFFLYWKFRKSQTDHPRTTRAAVWCGLLVIVWLIVFAVLA